MFIENKYTKCYFSIINRAKSRTLPPFSYTEKHHIIPKSLGGSNLEENLARLTAREHFICHLLLPKMTVGKNKTKMVYAIWRLCTSNKTAYKINSTTYEKFKKQRSRLLSSLAGPDHYNRGRKTGRSSETFTDEWKSKISIAAKTRNLGSGNPMYGKNHSEKSRKQLSTTRKQRSSDPSWNIRPACSAEKALKIKEANLGKRWVHNKATKERKYINPLLVADYISIGWELGLGPKNP